MKGVRVIPIAWRHLEDAVRPTDEGAAHHYPLVFIVLDMELVKIIESDREIVIRSSEERPTAPVHARRKGDDDGVPTLG